MNIAKIVGRNIKFHRKSRGITQPELLKAIGYKHADRQLLDNWERGAHLLPIEDSVKIGKYFNIDPRILFTRCNSPARSCVVIIGENLKCIRTLKGFTQEKLAARMKINSTLITSWETNRHNPSLKNFKHLCDILSVPATRLTKPMDIDVLLSSEGP